jgi:CheY-like chemotaxis protein
MPEMTADGQSVLVVEDDLALREMVQEVLHDAGYQVVTAGDGQEALMKVQERMPRVILLDMKMPRMDGWEFAHLFRRQYPHGAAIVVMTAAPDAQQRAAEIAAESYLSKPFDVGDLLRVVAHVVA